MKFPGWLAKAAIIAMWLPVLGVLGWRFEKHEATPGELGTFAHAWPDNSNLTPDPARPTLLMFTHPQCPCTRASMNELDQIVSFHPGKAKVYVVVLSPTSVGRTWIESDTTAHAKRINGVQVFEDKDGAECKRFGVKTSGTVLAFSPNGRQELFRGGITPALGHEGDCEGVSAIDRYLETGQMSVWAAPVFGCFLF